MDAGIERQCLKWGSDSVLPKGGVMKDSAATFVRLQANTVVIIMQAKRSAMNQ